MSKFWYNRHPLCWLLLPFSALFMLASWMRGVYLRTIKQTTFSVPIIVVGNLTVGGAGKTPLVIALANALQEKGLRVGIVSRGYGARGVFPRAVDVSDLACDVGDEPLLIAQKTACPVVVAPKRVDAVNYLLRHYQPQIVISDDGLQHYAMGRSIEIVVIDGVRGLGNGFVLPAGPLRESARRLKTVDFVVVNSGHWKNAYSMSMIASDMTNLVNGDVLKVTDLNASVAAVAGIGNPQRFHMTLSDLGVVFNAYSFADHYAFKPQDLLLKEDIIVMTDKDAVKCRPFATKNMYVLPVLAKLESSFWDALWKHKQLKEVL